MPTPFEILPGLTVGDGKKLLLLAGPCQIESREHCLMIASALKKAIEGLPINLIFKSSFDKANRTSLKGARGVGVDAGLRILEEVRKESGLALVTDVHDPEQARAAADVVDILQTPAFLCRQTDLLLAAGATNKPINVKKGQFLAPQDMAHVADKIASTGNRRIMLCERGSCFGYRDLVVDMRGLVIMRELGFPVIFDATHSVQSMGGEGGSSGGARQYVFPLIRAAAAVGIDGLFIECHEEPTRAPSDGASMLPLSVLKEVLHSAVRIWEAGK